MNPNDSQNETDYLREYFRRSMPDFVVMFDSDTDLRAAGFRFDGDQGLNYLLKISREAIEDNTTTGLVQCLEAAKWREVISQLPSDKYALFTRQGFTIRHRGK